MSIIALMPHQSKDLLAGEQGFHKNYNMADYSISVTVNNNKINGIFTQDNPSVLSTVINGVLLTNKLEIIKIYKLKTIKNYNTNYNTNYK